MRRGRHGAACVGMHDHRMSASPRPGARSEESAAERTAFAQLRPVRASLIVLLARTSVDYPASGRAVRIEETTSKIARVVAAAPFPSSIIDAWSVPLMTRWTLSVDKVARASCFADQPSALPLPASSTINGLSAKSRKDAACSTEELARRYSAIVLPRWLAVGTPTRRPRPRRAEVETSAETRPLRS